MKDKPKQEQGQEQEPRVAETPVTYEVYAGMPDDGNRYEVANGQLELMSPAPSVIHQAMSFEVHSILNAGCRNDYIILSAPLDVILSDTEVRQPDLVMIHNGRKSIISRRGIEGAPDLVVEISSEHSRRRDKVQKTKVYAKYGVPEYWIFDLTNFTLEQFQLKQEVYELVDVYAGDDLIRSDKLPCVSFTMNDLLRQLPELPDGK